MDAIPRALHSDLFIKTLLAIEPRISVERFSAISGISGSVLKTVLDFLTENNLCVLSDDIIEFSDSSKLKAAFLALQIGCDIESVSGYLSWKDFEILTSEVLASFGYETRTNLLLTKPRMEIDVIGISGEFAIAIDCKHWKRNNISAICRASMKQATRAQRLLNWDDSITKVVPVILTLHTESEKFVCGVPIVPIQKFGSFVSEIRSFLPEICLAC